MKFTKRELQFIKHLLLGHLKEDLDNGNFKAYSEMTGCCIEDEFPKIYRIEINKLRKFIKRFKVKEKSYFIGDKKYDKYF
jgi:hypothetical protein